MTRAILAPLYNLSTMASKKYGKTSNFFNSFGSGLSGLGG
jgi:hypothetical protein